MANKKFLRQCVTIIFTFALVLLPLKTMALTAADSIQQAYVKATNTEANDWFGYAVAISGNTMVISAPHEDSNGRGIYPGASSVVESNNSAVDSGAVYVYTRTGLVWTRQAYIKASNADAGDNFGISVALEGEFLVVGANYEGGGSSGINGDQNSNSVPRSGAIYVFKRSGTTWTQESYIKPSTPGHDTQFGAAVAISGPVIVVGATHWTVAGAIGAGGVYMFGRDAQNEWKEEAIFASPEPRQFNHFGESVSVSGDRAVVGAGSMGVKGNGSAWVFKRTNRLWSQEASLVGSNEESTDSFGTSVAISGDTIVVGASSEAGSGTGVNSPNSADNSLENSGAAYVFIRNGTTWTQEAYLKAPRALSHLWFGDAVAIDGQNIIIGARYENNIASGINSTIFNQNAIFSGAAYVFQKSSSSWSQILYLKSSNTGGGDTFGYAVDIDGDSMISGAFNEDSSLTGINPSSADNENASNSGSAYVFGPRTTNTAPQAPLNLQAR